MSGQARITTLFVTCQSESRDIHRSERRTIRILSETDADQDMPICSVSGCVRYRPGSAGLVGLFDDRSRVGRFGLEVKPDCENAPKKALVRDWLIALASSAPDQVTGLLDPDVRWEHVGTETWTGVDEVQARLPSEPAESLQISRLLSHSKEVAAEARIVLGGGSKERFAHLLHFTSHSKEAKLESITTYSVKTLD